jgi:hypothetical protein
LIPPWKTHDLKKQRRQLEPFFWNLNFLNLRVKGSSLYAFFRSRVFQRGIRKSRRQASQIYLTICVLNIFF